jgi:RNA polymerase sigma-70 factor (TIGR02957 family)
MTDVLTLSPTRRGPRFVTARAWIAGVTGPADDSLRPLMFGIAYRMLGSVSEAEDVVQDAFLRIQEHPPTGIRNPAAYVTTVTTRLAIDELRSARRRRESYAGTWLPEPVVTDPAAQPEPHAERYDTISLAALVMLERLTPVERAVFVLRTAFGYDYDDIAGIVGKSAANCRQILKRARGRVTRDEPRFTADPARRDELARRFLTAAADGDIAGLEQLLSADVVFYGDGGGNAAALAEPVTGRTRVARFVAGITRQAVARGLRILPVLVNGDPGVLAVDPAGAAVGVMAVQSDGHQVVAIRNILNPDKLAHLARTAADGPPR